MKFLIFKWWEKWAKPIVYIIIVGLTVTLLTFYRGVYDKNGQIAFVVSIGYAFILFIITIPINKIERYTADRIYERESYYLALKKLRELTDATIKKISVDDTEGYYNHILTFQLFTGRDDNSIRRRMMGEKAPIYAKENGFVYTEKMKNMETAYLKALKGKDVNELLKIGKRLNKYYRKSCKRLEKNYARIMNVYGGALQYLVERDEAISDTDYSLNDIKSKVDDIAGEIDSLRSDIDGMTDAYADNQSELLKYCEYIYDRLKDIEDTMMEFPKKITH